MKKDLLKTIQEKREKIEYLNSLRPITIDEVAGRLINEPDPISLIPNFIEDVDYLFGKKEKFKPLSLEKSDCIAELLSILRKHRNLLISYELKPEIRQIEDWEAHLVFYDVPHFPIKPDFSGEKNDTRILQLQPELFAIAFQAEGIEVPEFLKRENIYQKKKVPKLAIVHDDPKKMAQQINHMEVDYARYTSGYLSGHEFSALLCKFDPNLLTYDKYKTPKDTIYWISPSEKHTFNIPSIYAEKFKKIYAGVENWSQVISRIEYPIFCWLENVLVRCYPQWEDIPEDLVEAAKKRLKNELISRELSENSSMGLSAKEYPLLTAKLGLYQEEKIVNTNSDMSTEAPRNIGAKREETLQAMLAAVVALYVSTKIDPKTKKITTKYRDIFFPNISAVVTDILQLLEDNKCELLPPKGGSFKIRL